MEAFIIKAQCTIFKNNIQINNKKKNKIFSITLDSKSKTLFILGKSDDQLFKYPIQKLKAIHKKFIDQGKITIEFDQQVEGTIQKGLSSVNQNVNYDGNIKIFLSNACKENLQVLVNKMINLKKDCQQSVSKNNEEKKKQQKVVQIPKSRKTLPQPLKMENQQMNLLKKPRKSFFALARNDRTSSVNQQKSKNSSENLLLKKQIIKLTSLPQIILRQIFSFVGINLSQRLICKQFEQLVIKNITNLKLNQEVDQLTFHKLAKWAINLQGKFKNVKTFKFEDRHDHQQLIKNKAKSLKFSNWKQISAKHILQLKGLRIYCLQLPYLMKFQLSNVFGLRMVQLRLKGKGVILKNSMVKDEDVLYLINNLVELRVIQIAYCSTKLLCQIKKPQKMQQIRIGMLNKIGNQDWFKFAKFENLQILSIQNTQRLGNPEDHCLIVCEPTFPDKITTLEIGFNLSRQSKCNIPLTLKNLKLLGAHFRNVDIQQFYLPSLQNLDIINCPNIGPQCLYNMANLTVHTNWDRNRVDYASKYYSLSNISIRSVRGFSHC